MAERIVTLLPHGELRAPFIVVAFSGWTDAGAAGTLALAHLATIWNAQPIAQFDADMVFDYRSSRPTLDIESGIRGPLQWPEIRCLWAPTPGERDAVLLTGPEPDLNWQGFCREVVALAGHLGIRQSISLGAIPAAVAHTRPVPLLATASRPDIVDSSVVMQGSFRVPAGATSATESSFGQAGLEAVGFWAQVPHYLGQAPYPGAAAALLRRLGGHVGVGIDADELEVAAQKLREQTDAALAEQPEAAAFVRNLEALAGPAPAGEFPTQLPSGEELATEIERYLRGHPPK